MADSSLNKNFTSCPSCSSTSQKGGLSSEASISPVLVVEMSQTSSVDSTESVFPPDRKKEKNTSRDAPGKDLVNIEDSACQHNLTTHSLVPFLASFLFPESLSAHSLP